MVSSTLVTYGFYYWIQASAGQSKEDLKLGYLYIQSGPGAENNWGASWVQESFSQFKLGILDVNANSSILPNHTLSFELADTSGDEAIALKGAAMLIDDVVGIVGTGYSLALRLPSGYCSVYQKPIVSPGSTLLSLTDKKSIPYLLRSIASDAGALKAMVAIVYDLGWRNALLMANKDFEDGAIQVLRPAMAASGISQFMFVYSDTTDAQGNPLRKNQQELQAKMHLIKMSGFRIIVLYNKGVDMKAIVDTSAEAGVGFWSIEHVWILTQAGWVNMVHQAPQVFTVLAESPQTGMKLWYHERWSKVSTFWNASIHGGYDQVTKLPFFGENATRDYTVWDTHYAQHGDGVPDMWGEYVYDTVWLYAHAMHAMILDGQDVRNGRELRRRLLQTNFEGITGNIAFDQNSQDRIQPTAIYMSSPSGPLQVGFGTEHLNSWDLIGPCSKGCTTLTRESIAFPGGAVPSDGSALDVQTSFFYCGVDSYEEGEQITVIAHARNSFKQVPCQSPCSANASSATCTACLDDFAPYDKIAAVFYSSADEILQPVETPVYDVEPASGILRILLPAGLPGGGKRDRQVSVRVQYKSVFFEGVESVILKSSACKPGHFKKGTGPDGRTICTPCEPGTFGAEYGETICSNCTPGSYSESKGVTACAWCDAGRYQDSFGTTSCIRCGAGTYTNTADTDTGSLTCEPCPHAMSTIFEGAAVVTDCMCLSGQYFDLASVSCQACPGIGVSCPGGYTYSAYKTATGPDPTVRIQAGFMTLPDSLSVFRCRTEQACVSERSPYLDIASSSMCNDGYDNDAIACARCLPGYFGVNCQECSGVANQRAAFAIVVFVGLVFACAFVYYKNMFPPDPVGTTCRELIKQFQALSLVGQFSIEYPESVRKFLDALAITLADLHMFNFPMECLFDGSWMTRYLFNLMWPWSLLVGFLAVYCLSILSWGIVKRFKADKETVTTSRMLRDILPKRGCIARIMLFFDKIIVSGFHGVSLETRISWFWPVKWVDMYSTILVTHSTLFIALTQCSLSLFNKRGNPNDVYTLERFPDVVWASPEWWLAFPWSMLGLCIYNLGFIAFLSYILIVAPKRFGTSPFFRDAYGGFWDSLHTDAWWFCLVEMCYSLFLTIIPAITSEGKVQVFNSGMLTTIYLCILFSSRPWKHYINYAVDSVCRLGMLTFLFLTVAFGEDPNTEIAMSKTMFGITQIIVIATTFLITFLILGHHVWTHDVAQVKHLAKTAEFAERLEDMCTIVSSKNSLELRAYALGLLDKDMLALDRSMDILQFTLLGLQSQSCWRWRCDDMPYKVAGKGVLENLVAELGVKRSDDYRAIARQLYLDLDPAFAMQHTDTVKSPESDEGSHTKKRGSYIQEHVLVHSKSMKDKWLQVAGVSNSTIQLFHQIDTDGDGKLTLEEFRDGVKDSLGDSSTLTTDDLEKVFQFIDADGNGSISMIEFERARSSAPAPTQHKRWHNFRLHRGHLRRKEGQSRRKTCEQEGAADRLFQSSEVTSTGVADTLSGQSEALSIDDGTPLVLTPSQIAPSLPVEGRLPSKDSKSTFESQGVQVASQASASQGSNNTCESQGVQVASQASASVHSMPLFLPPAQATPSLTCLLPGSTKAPISL